MSTSEGGEKKAKCCDRKKEKPSPFVFSLSSHARHASAALCHPLLAIASSRISELLSSLHERKQDIRNEWRDKDRFGKREEKTIERTVNFFLSFLNLFSLSVPLPFSLFRFLSLSHTPFPFPATQLSSPARTRTKIPVAQFWAAAAWWTSRGGSLSPAATEPSKVLWGLALIAVGQILNTAVYGTIGGDGVYYGVRLGRTVPWVHGFPFRLFARGGKPGTGLKIPHPQYLGSAATAWGLLLAFSGAAPVGATVLVGYWTALYVLTALQEDYLLIK